jgi:glycerol dehydrogenase
MQLVLEGRSTQQIDEALGFCTAVGLPATLAELGITILTPKQAGLVAERALAVGETSHNEPFELSPTAVVDALFAADALGRTRRR